MKKYVQPEIELLTFHTETVLEGEADLHPSAELADNGTTPIFYKLNQWY